MPQFIFVRVLVIGLSLWAVSPAESADAPVAASIESTLKSDFRQIRQLAFDGDAETFFSSEQNPSDNDHVTLRWDQPVAVKSIEITTGRPDGRDHLESGTLQVSEDGKAFENLAAFQKGIARGEPSGRKIQAVRIQAKPQDHLLAIREIKLDSDPPVAIFRYPVEILVDVSDAPEMKEWTENVARICERAYPMLNDELRSDGFRPARVILLKMKADYDGVAATSDRTIVGSVKYFKGHPVDVGAMVHETAHVVQAYRSQNFVARNRPGWLVEGIADYVRFFKFEPGKLGRIDPDRAHYNGSYRTTAAFLAYLVEKYDKDAVLKLNAALREGKPTEAMFEQLTGKTVQELDDEWRKTLRE